MNKYKKSDAKGNKLPEQIGKGIDECHLKKVLEARKNDSIQTFRLPSDLKEEFNKGDNISELLREFVRTIVKRRKQ